MPKRIHLLIIATGLLAISCCPQKTMVVLIPDPGGNVGQVTVTNDTGTVEMNRAGEAVIVSDKKSPPSPPEIISAAEITADFAQILAIELSKPKRFLLYFKSQSTELTAESAARIPELVDTITRNESQDISVIGHSDSAGDYHYNLALSKKRATAISDLLIEHGISVSIIQITSHGEKNPFVKTADNVSEPKNRRVEVVVR